LEECSVRPDDHGKPACYYMQLHASDASLPGFLGHCSLEDAASLMQLLRLGEQGGGQHCDARKTEYAAIISAQAPSRGALAD
jgi:hypothetical protein